MARDVDGITAPKTASRRATPKVPTAASGARSEQQYDVYLDPTLPQCWLVRQRPQLADQLDALAVGRTGSPART